jgi:hypothetical protein
MDAQTFTTPGPLALIAKIPSGLLDVRASATDTTILRVERIKDPADLWIRFDEVGSGHRLSIEHRGKGRFGFFGDNEVVLVVECPERTTVEMSAGSADLAVDGRIRSIDFSSGSGDVNFRNTDGDVRIKVGSGDVEGGRIGGDMTMHGASGDIRVDDVVGRFEVKTASGDIWAGAVDGDVSITSVSGDVELHSLRQGRTQVRSVSGDVRIGVAAGTDVRLDVSTTSGDARSDLAMVAEPTAEGRLLDLKCSSVSGDVLITRSPARELL